MIVHVLRKPLIGTVAQNALQHGCGALNIDECRIEPNGPEYIGLKNQQTVSKNGTTYNVRKENRTFNPSSLGRWPANLVHNGSEQVFNVFPAEAGFRRKGGSAAWFFQQVTIK
jgi:site-specific DNA-methyltransferase (adenine-specific)